MAIGLCSDVGMEQGRIMLCANTRTTVTANTTRYNFITKKIWLKGSKRPNALVSLVIGGSVVRTNLGTPNPKQRNVRNVSVLN